MMRAIVFVLIFAFGLAALWASEHSNPPNANLPMVNADYPVCVMQHPPPLISQERQVVGIPYNPEIV